MRVWAKTDGEVREGKFLVVRRDGSIPCWPHFVMGARDPAVPDALRAYANKGEELGYDPAFVVSVRELADDYEAYRAKEGPGDADAGPHRVDSSDVIRVMRGDDGLVQLWHETHNVKK
jgi:hypothetical protein